MGHIQDLSRRAKAKTKRFSEKPIKQTNVDTRLVHLVVSYLPRKPVFKPESTETFLKRRKHPTFMFSEINFQIAGSQTTTFTTLPHSAFGVSMFLQLGDDTCSLWIMEAIRTSASAGGSPFSRRELCAKRVWLRSLNTQKKTKTTNSVSVMFDRWGYSHIKYTHGSDNDSPVPSQTLKNPQGFELVCSSGGCGNMAVTMTVKSRSLSLSPLSSICAMPPNVRRCPSWIVGCFAIQSCAHIQSFFDRLLSLFVKT